MYDTSRLTSVATITHLTTKTEACVGRMETLTVVACPTGTSPCMGSKVKVDGTSQRKGAGTCGWYQEGREEGRENECTGGGREGDGEKGGENG